MTNGRHGRGSPHGGKHRHRHRHPPPADTDTDTGMYTDSHMDTDMDKARARERKASVCMREVLGQSNMILVAMEEEWPGLMALPMALPMTMVVGPCAPPLPLFTMATATP